LPRILRSDIRSFNFFAIGPARHGNGLPRALNIHDGLAKNPLAIHGKPRQKLGCNTCSGICCEGDAALKQGGQPRCSVSDIEATTSKPFA
jgi:hypothetical protein